MEPSPTFETCSATLNRNIYDDRVLEQFGSLTPNLRRYLSR